MKYSHGLVTGGKVGLCRHNFKSGLTNVARNEMTRIHTYIHVHTNVMPNVGNTLYEKKVWWWLKILVHNFHFHISNENLSPYFQFPIFYDSAIISKLNIFFKNRKSSTHWAKVLFFIFFLLIIVRFYVISSMFRSFVIYLFQILL